jgi:uncharacterized LabA/DUF88 family protein
VTVATVAAYIDGFNLYFGMKHKYRRKYLWLDVVEMIRQVRPNDQVVVVRYFSAIVKGEPAAAANQQTYIDAMKAHHGPTLLDVHVGRFKDRRIKPCRVCRSEYECQCPRTYRSFEEKETDVGIGAMMVADAALQVGDVSLFVSADTDFVPAVRAVGLVAPTRPVYIALPPGNTGASSRLTAFPNVSSFFINESTLRNAQLPAAVTDAATGQTYTRPPKWS